MSEGLELIPMAIFAPLLTSEVLKIDLPGETVSILALILNEDCFKTTITVSVRIIPAAITAAPLIKILYPRCILNGLSIRYYQFIFKVYLRRVNDTGK